MLSHINTLGINEVRPIPPISEELNKPVRWHLKTVVGKLPFFKATKQPL